MGHYRINRIPEGNSKITWTRDNCDRNS